MEEKEIWKEIEGFETYQVSNLGRVRRMDTSECPNITSRRTYTRIRKGHILNGSPNKITGLIQVMLRGVNGYKLCYLHRLVAIAFLKDSKGEGMNCVGHIDGNKTNNRADNLEWKARQSYGARKPRVVKEPRLYKEFYYIQQKLTNGAVIASYVITTKDDWSRLAEFGFTKGGVLQAGYGKSSHSVSSHYYKGYLWEVDRIKNNMSKTIDESND